MKRPRKPYEVESRELKPRFDPRWVPGIVFDYTIVYGGWILGELKKTLVPTYRDSNFVWWARTATSALALSAVLVLANHTTGQPSGFVRNLLSKNKPTISMPTMPRLGVASDNPFERLPFIGDTCEVKSSSGQLNFRREPKRDAPIVGSVPNGTKLGIGDQTFDSNGAQYVAVENVELPDPNVEAMKLFNAAIESGQLYAATSADGDLLCK